jgi:hypothetical protein
MTTPVAEPGAILFDGKPAVILGFEEHFDEGGYAGFVVIEQDGQTYGIRWPSPRVKTCEPQGEQQ